MAFAAGIVLQEYVLKETQLHGSAGLLLFGFFLAGVVFTYRNNFDRNSPWLGLTALLLLAFLGCWRKQTAEPIQDKSHLLNLPGQITFYKGVLADDPQEKTNTWAFPLRLIASSDGDSLRKATGLVQIYLRKDAPADSLLEKLRYGAVVWIHGTPAPIKPLRNPGGFDFRQYMARKHIYHQDYVTGEEVRWFGHAPPSFLFDVSLRIKRELLLVLRQYLPGIKERAIAEALILGHKDEIDIEQRNAYATAGAMHVLAVSGLHVGIIYMIVGLLLKPLERKRSGRIVRFLVLFAALWIFAFVTGLSASVLRAVVMFSIVLLAEAFRRRANIYNSLALAGFLLLLYNPNFLFQVGYQLSFLAVLGIVYLQPKLYVLWEAPNYLLDKIWGITCVSLAAQLATGPLSIFYFNQFPTWFLLSNLLVIPGAFLVLTLGLLLFSVHYVSPFLAGGVAFLLNYLISWLNSFVARVELLPYSLIAPVSISAAQTWLLYLAILGFLSWWAIRKFRWFVYGCVFCGGFILLEADFIVTKHRKKQLVVYDMSGFTVLNYQEGGRIFQYHDEAFTVEERLYNLNVRPFLIREGALTPFTSRAGFDLPQGAILPDTLVAVQAGELKVLHLQRRLPNHKRLLEPLQADVLIVSNNSLDAASLGSQLFAGEVVFDGTNRYSYLNRTVEKLKQADQKFYVIPWEGAYQQQY